jgi:N-acetylmuramoyl-L-alanine amidase CwlA
MRIDEAFRQLNVVQDFIPIGNSNRPGRRLEPTLITIHNTDNDSPGANAAAHAKYQKGADARKREVSWHFTVDDKSVFQSLPTNEIGWHAGKRQGNATSIGIEICMNPELDVPATYDRAALLTAVMAFQHNISVARGVVTHQSWTGKHCPRVLLDKPDGWKDFLAQVKAHFDELENVEAPRIAFRHEEDA